jgi:hypothetical protein
MGGMEAISVLKHPSRSFTIEVRRELGTWLEVRLIGARWSESSALRDPKTEFGAGKIQGFACWFCLVHVDV